MSLNDRVFASLSKILDEWAAARDEILLQARCIISITCEAHAIQLLYWINSSMGYHIYICMQIGEKKYGYLNGCWSRSKPGVQFIYVCKIITHFHHVLVVVFMRSRSWIIYSSICTLKSGPKLMHVGCSAVHSLSCNHAIVDTYEIFIAYAICILSVCTVFTDADMSFNLLSTSYQASPLYHIHYLSIHFKFLLRLCSDGASTEHHIEESKQRTGTILIYVQVHLYIIKNITKTSIC